MKKLLIFILLISLSLSLIACTNEKPDENKNPPDGGNDETYTVTWKNFDGTVLETDTDVKKGSVPSYDGATPTKETDTGNDASYVFSGWTPALDFVMADVTYTATFKEAAAGESFAGAEPALNADGTVSYGLYPQSRVSDSALIEVLDTLSPSNVNGWYLHDGEFYAKCEASVYSGESYTFDDGEAIVNGEKYWFKCEPIKWKILSDEGGRYYLLSVMLLDSAVYNAEYENGYKGSSIREFLNGDFYNTAFALNASYIKTVTVDNSAATTGFESNQYATENTLDNVFLPSYKDYLNAEYGFTSSAEKSDLREAKTTDYARATGAWCHTRNNSDKSTQHNGSYWTRSASGEYYYCASVVNSGGYMSNYPVTEASHSVRPAIYISITSLGYSPY